MGCTEIFIGGEVGCKMFGGEEEKLSNVGGMRGFGESEE